MTLNDLIEVLQSAASIAEHEGREEPQVMIATQPSYPLASTLEGVTFRDGKVWLLEGNNEGYAERSLWEG